MCGPGEVSIVGEVDWSVGFGMVRSMTEMMLSSESMLVSLCRLLSLDESEFSSCEKRLSMR